MRIHGGEKLLHRFRVAIEELAIQIPWVPINKNDAEFEHGDGAFSLEGKILTGRTTPVEVSVFSECAFQWKGQPTGRL